MRDFKRVIPSFEFVAERIYVREGRLINVYAYVEGDNPIGCLTSPEDIKLGELLFTISAPTAQDADKVMTDLFYGEYTGA